VVASIRSAFFHCGSILPPPKQMQWAVRTGGFCVAKCLCSMDPVLHLIRGMCFRKHRAVGVRCL
jgi:hypothetical protein